MGKQQKNKQPKEKQTNLQGTKNKSKVSSVAGTRIKSTSPTDAPGNNQSLQKLRNVPRNLFIKDADSPYTYDVNVFGRQKQVIVRQSSADETWPGGALWDIGVLLAHVFASPTLSPIHSNRWTRTKVIELGAGVGLTGIVLGVLGAQMVLVTDLPVVVDQITKPNVELNSQHYKKVGSKSELRVKAMALSWGDESDEKDALSALGGTCPDLIVAGDVSYQHKPGAPSHFEELLHTVLKLSNQETIFVFGHRVRMAASNDLLDSFQKYFDYLRDPIPAEDIDPSFANVAKHNISIHVLKRKPVP